MNIPQVILKKRSGNELSKSEIKYVIDGILDDSIPRYQVSSLLMAIFFQGMTAQETSDLTETMINSGLVVKFPKYTHSYVDKHSTGGVGDGTSLLIAPLVAACDVRVPMLSGRALGHTGGTLDKLDSIPNYRTLLPVDKFKSQVVENGYAMSGQTKDLVPADSYLYALRDVTATVESIPLITSSILSKKFAEGSDALVLDVKCGSGGFAKTIDFAEQLASMLKRTAVALGKKISISITNMDQPLGSMIGNFLEVEQAAVLLGKAVTGSPAQAVANSDIDCGLLDDYRTISMHLAAHMLLVAGRADDMQSAQKLLEDALDSGRAWQCFCDNITAQGGDVDAFMSMLGTFRAPQQLEIFAEQDGFIDTLDAYAFGQAGVYLGVGRETVDAEVHPDVGIQLHKKHGSAVQKGEKICTLFSREKRGLDLAGKHLFEHGIKYSTTQPQPLTLVIREL